MDVERILQDIGFDPILRKGNNLWVRCPHPEHEDIHPSCSVNAKSGLWKCWSCDKEKGMKGNLTFLIRVKTGCSWKRAKEITAGEATVYDTMHNLKGKLVYDESTAKQRIEESKLPDIWIPSDARPLKKRTKENKEYWDYLTGRDVSTEAIRFFKVCYCRTGLYGGRILAPVMVNRLPKGFVARMIYDDEVPIGHDDDKYLFPHLMKVQKVIYNYDHITVGKPLIVVEGVTDVWHLWQMDHKIFRNVCGILTSRVSSFQLDLLASKKPKVIYWMMDGDVGIDNKEGKFEANRKMLESAFDDIRYVLLDKGKDPTDYSESQLTRLMEIAGPAQATHLSVLKKKLKS